MKKFSLVRQLLDTILGVGNKSLSVNSLYARLNPTRIEKWRYNHAINYLEQTEKIKIVKNGTENFIKLTQRGKLQTLLRKVEKSDALRRKWDGKWRLVIWDIPEVARKQRNRMRYALKDLGFRRLQQSVYIRPHPLTRDAVVYLQESGLINYIRFIRVDKMDEEKQLLKEFSLYGFGRPTKAVQSKNN